MSSLNDAAGDVRVHSAGTDTEMLPLASTTVTAPGCTVPKSSESGTRPTGVSRRRSVVAGYARAGDEGDRVDDRRRRAVTGCLLHLGEERERAVGRSGGTRPASVAPAHSVQVWAQPGEAAVVERFRAARLAISLYATLASTVAGSTSGGRAKSRVPGMSKPPTNSAMSGAAAIVGRYEPSSLTPNPC